MTNHMKDVANLLGVELNQEFEVECKSGTLVAKITEDDILVLNGSEFLKLYNAAILLKNLIRGKYTIKPIRWCQWCFEEPAKEGCSLCQACIDALTIKPEEDFDLDKFLEEVDND